MPKLETSPEPIIEREPRPTPAETLADEEDGIVDLPYDEWMRGLEEIMARAKSRAGRYPPGFELNIDRGAMYEDPE